VVTFYRIPASGDALVQFDSPETASLAYGIGVLHNNNGISYQMAYHLAPVFPDQRPTDPPKNPNRKPNHENAPALSVRSLQDRWNENGGHRKRTKTLDQQTHSNNRTKHLRVLESQKG
jgi:hypothetical protein